MPSTLTFLILAVLCSNISAGPVDSLYKHSNQAGGWFKYYKSSDWSNAVAHCSIEGAVVASPVTSLIREEISIYVKQQGHSGAWLMTGVRADVQKGDYYSEEGVLLSNMPVIYNFNASTGSNECVKWRTGSTEVQTVDCNTKLDYVCFKKRESVNVVGCGTRDLDYKYDARSGSCYKLHHNAMTWSKAYKKCRKEGASLAVINNELERLVMKELYANIAGYPWVGIRDWAGDLKSWTTVQGETLSEAGFAGWGSGEPSGPSHCVSINEESKYVNYDCDGTRTFICEKKPEILTREFD